MPSMRPPIMGTRHMVSAGHYLASHAAFQILESGGNAIDAGVAAGIALGVTQTEKVSFGGVAPIIMVFNNGMYGTIRMYQERTYPGRVSGTALTNPDFARFIESFGGHGEVVERTEELVPAFQRAKASGKPAIIEVRTNPEQVTNRATIAQLRAQAGAR